MVYNTKGESFLGIKNRYKIIILIDTREKRNELIIDSFEKQNIEYEYFQGGLLYGDYSAKVVFEDGKEVSLYRDIVIERKRELTELSNTLTQGQRRFINELERAKFDRASVKLLIVDGDYYRNILEHNYRTKLEPDMFLKLLFKFQHEYHYDIVGLDERLSASYIYRNIKAYVEDNIDSLRRIAVKGA